MDVHVECICPPKGDAVRHPEGDTVVLRERLDFRSASNIRNAIRLLPADAPQEVIVTTLTESYLWYGIESWTVVDDRGKALGPSRQAIEERLLANLDVAMAVGDAADELYGEKVVIPLLLRASSSSPHSPTNGSTSATTPSSPQPPKPSRRSSTSTSRMDATGTTSALRAGASSSSPSSMSAD